MGKGRSTEATRALTKQLRDLSALQAFTAALAQEESEERAGELLASGLNSVWEGPLGVVALKSEGTKGGWEFYGGIREAPLDASIIKNLLSILREMDLAPKPGTATVLERALPSGLRRHELEALHVFPVRTLERQLGALLLGTSRPVPPSPEQETLLSSLANQLAIVLDNARLRRALKDHNLQLEATVRQRTSELRSLLEIGQAVCAHLDRHPLFHSVSAAVQSVVPFDRMGIILPSSEENGLLLYIFETHGGEARLRPGVTFPRAGTVPGWVLEHKQSFIGSSLKDFGAFPVSREILKQEGMQSNCVLPLLVEGGAVGALVFLGKEPDHFSSVQLPLLEEMASVVALALDNCLAYEEITRLKDQLAQENIYLQEEIKTEHNFDEIVGRSPALKKVLTRVEKVAPADSSVLINGETGTGKELIARAIHDLSQRKDRPLIKVNCAALPIGLIESELFGHEKGAFTGALTKKTGRFELAHQGTIFLDEIGDLPPEIQVKLLRILTGAGIRKSGWHPDHQGGRTCDRCDEPGFRKGSFRELFQVGLVLSPECFSDSPAIFTGEGRRRSPAGPVLCEPACVQDGQTN